MLRPVHKVGFSALCVMAALALFPHTAGAGLITATNNAFVFKNQPDTDQNESNDLMVKSNGNNSFSRISYLRFDISGLNTSDTVFLDLSLEDIGTGNVEQLFAWSLDDGVAGETTWSSSLTFNTRPDGTGDLPTADVTSIASHGYVKTGVITIPIEASVLQALLTADSNDELTIVLGNNSTHATVQTRLSALGNSGGLMEPRLRSLAAKDIITIEESGYGGSLREVSEASFTFNQSGAQAKVGEGGAGNNTEYVQMMLFELPHRPDGGFLPADTSLRITIDSEDVVTAGEHADLWAVGYVPATDIGDVGSNLNNGGVTDIDDFFLSEADTETKTGWNIGSDNTTKLWDDLAGQFSTNTLASPPEVNTNLTSFINDLFVNHSAAKGDYLLLRLNYDTDMTDYDDWIFRTGDAASGKPVLTLTRPPGGTLFVFQ